MATDTLLLLVFLVAGSHLSLAAPSIPTSLKVTDVRSGNISISWRHGGGPVDYFTVTLANLAPHTVVKNYTSQNYNGTLMMYFAVTPGTTYQIYVTAFEKGSSSLSRLITFTAGEKQGGESTKRPATPTTLKVTRVHDTDNISISWRHGGGPVDYFRVTLEDTNRGQRTVKNYTRQNYSVILMTTFAFIPGTAYKIYVSAFLNGSSSTAELDFNPQGSIQCYVCSGSNLKCYRPRTLTDAKQQCQMGQACWMRHQKEANHTTYIRGCETTTCSSEFQKWTCATDGSTTTCSKCCKSNACNAELLTSSSGLTMAEFPLLISCLFLTSLFVMV